MPIMISPNSDNPTMRGQRRGGSTVLLRSGSTVGLLRVAEMNGSCWLTVLPRLFDWRKGLGQPLERCGYGNGLAIDGRIGNRRRRLLRYLLAHQGSHRQHADTDHFVAAVQMHVDGFGAPL